MPKTRNEMNSSVSIVGSVYISAESLRHGCWSAAVVVRAQVRVEPITGGMTTASVEGM
jgi:hypothetical protein